MGVNPRIYTPGRELEFGSALRLHVDPEMNEENEMKRAVEILQP